MSNPKPPLDIIPSVFFTEWLPAHFKPTQSDSLRIKLQVTLTGELGGTWTLDTTTNNLVVTPQASSDADVSIQQSVMDWRALFIGDSDPALQLLPQEKSVLDLLYININACELLDQIQGNITIYITYYNERTWSLSVLLKTGSDISVSLDSETVTQLKNKTLTPMQAYMDGMIKIDGDIGFAIQTGAILVSRLAATGMSLNSL